MNKLAQFPLEWTQQGEKDRDVVIFGIQGWNLTVGDVLDARAAITHRDTAQSATPATATASASLTNKQAEELREIGMSWMSESGRDILDDWIDASQAAPATSKGGDDGR